LRVGQKILLDVLKMWLFPTGKSSTCGIYRCFFGGMGFLEQIQVLVDCFGGMNMPCWG
jgi:hypothetical protein